MVNAIIVRGNFVQCCLANRYAILAICFFQIYSCSVMLDFNIKEGISDYYPCT